MTNRFDYYLEGRAFEWTISIAMLLSGIEVLVWKQVVAFGAFQWLLTIMSQQSIGLFMIIVGWLRVSGLMMNGQRVQGIALGSYVRAVGSVLSASMWVQFALALSLTSIERGAPSIGLPFWVMFTISELYVAYTTVKNG